jgi:MFS family permease
VLVPAFAAAAGEPHWAGLLVTIWSAGSLVGGLLLAARGRRRAVSATYLLLLGGLAVTALALPFPRTVTQMAVVVAMFGLPLAPWLAVADELVSRAAPAPHMAAYFGWLQTAGQVGIAVGAGLAGPVVARAGTTTAFMLVPLALAGALALAVRMRDRLAYAGRRGAGGHMLTGHLTRADLGAHVHVALGRPVDSSPADR